MPLINCPDCGEEVSDIASVCPKCARPNPGGHALAEMQLSHLEGGNKDCSKKKRGVPRWVKFLLFIFLFVGVFYYTISTSNTLRLISLSSEDSLFSPAKVYAKFHNVGNDIDINYWVELGESEKKYCEGTTFFSDGERRTLSFSCRALNNYTGNFFVVWIPR